MKMKTLKELKVGNDKSYKDALKKYYYEIAPGLIKLVDEEEEQISAMLGRDALKILETDSGNLIVKYMETEDSIGITGMISKRGVISARDLPDILKLYAMLIEKLDEIEEDDNHWVSRTQMEGQLVFNIDHSYFIWRLTEIPSKYEELLDY